MLYPEFKTLMNDRFGWCFPEDIYNEIIEPVYIVVREEKAEFVTYCADKDLNGLQLLFHNLEDVEHFALLNFSIYQIHHVLMALRKERKALQEKEKALQSYRLEAYNLRMRIQGAVEFLKGEVE